MSKAPTDSGVKAADQGHDALTFHAHGADKIELPSGAFIADAHMTRDGDDLVLTTPDGHVAVIDGYFSADPAPLLSSPNGAVLTPQLVDSFSHSALEFAANTTANDESPVGAVEEVKGTATVTRADGTVETIAIGTPIYQGDIVQTDGKGAVNITFIDQTTMAVSENARLAVNEYTYDPHTESGTTNFSVLRGLFVFTSGLIGRDDPDDVKIDTPVGSIGIRGTIIAGEINPHGDSKISVLEGAIVVTNGSGDTTLSHAFETVKISSYDKPMTEMGVIDAHEISSRFSSVSTVAPTLFTSINDAAHEQKSSEPVHNDAPAHHDAPAGEPQSLNDSSHDTAPQSAPMDNGLASMTGTNTGLPTMGTAMGQSDVIPSSDSSTGLSSASTSTSAATSASSANTSTTAPATDTTTPATQTATAPAIGTTQQPPPSVIADGSHGTSGGNGGTVTGPSYTLAAGAITLTDIAMAGAVVGHITPSVTGTYTYATTSNYFSIGTNGDVQLTSAGAQALHSSLDVVQLGNLSVTATNSSGETSAHTFTSTVTDAGTVVSLLSPHTGLSIITDGLENNIGYTITAVGDINHDGFDDFVFSNDTNDSGQNHSYLVHGSAAGLPTSATVTTIGAEIIANGTPNTNFGETIVAGIGDFNGDHVNDFAVGQGLNNGGATGSGVVSVIGLNPALGVEETYTFTNTVSGTGIGSSVDGIGDINNDGYDDIIIGAASNSQAFLVHGGVFADGMALTGTALSGGAGFGSEVTGIGDYNGDGYTDFAVGAPGESSNAGTVTIYAGSATGTPTVMQTLTGFAGEGFGTEISRLGDINGDGLSDILVGGAGDTAHIYLGGSTSAASSLNVPTGYSLIGGGAIGDFNGDGYDDFNITLANSTGTHSYVVFGKDGFNAPIDLDYLKNPDNALDFKYSTTNNDEVEVNGVGDVNGDGYDDFAIGVPDANGTSAGNGGLLLIYGHGTGNTASGVSQTASADNQHLVGTTGSDQLSDGGFNNVSMRGGTMADVFEIHNTNFLGIDGGGDNGASLDRIMLAGNNANLDFSGVNYEKISGIEAIQFNGSNQTMTLTLENLFNLLKSSDDHSLRIDTLSGDSVLNIDAATASGSADSGTSGDSKIASALNEMGGNATAQSDNADYRHFTIGGLDLYIDKDVTVNVT